MTSARLAGLPPYPLQDVPEIMARLRVGGHDVIDLGAGDSRLPVPPVAIRALREASQDPALQGYGFQRGLPAYREAVAAWMARRFSVSVDPWREILPVIGSKEAIGLAAFALLDAGDTALIPDPGYAPYFGGAYFAGARIDRVPLRAEEGFLVSPDRIRSAPGTLRLVYLNYPNNPTAAVADESYLSAVVEACADRGSCLLLDNAYSELTFDGYRAPGLLDVPGGREIGIEFHSFSKTYNMTGWRLGWVAGNADLVSALRRVKTFFDTGSYLGIQAAGAAVLGEADRCIADTVSALSDRRDAAVPALRAAGLDVPMPLATLYLWFPVPGGDSRAWCRDVLERQSLVLMPGAELGDGGEGYARASLTVEPDRYAEVARRIGACL